MRNNWRALGHKACFSSFRVLRIHELQHESRDTPIALVSYPSPPLPPSLPLFPSRSFLPPPPLCLCLGSGCLHFVPRGLAENMHSVSVLNKSKHADSLLSENEKLSCTQAGSSHQKGISKGRLRRGVATNRKQQEEKGLKQGRSSNSKGQ